MLRVMRAITFSEYGAPSVLKLEERPDPRPGKGQVLVRVRACALNAADWHIVRADPFPVRFATGLMKPKIVPGCDMAGVVEAVGEGVQRFRVGDEVMGEMGSSGWGAFAELVSAPETVLVHKPENLSFQEAAAVPLAGVTAVQGLRRKGHLAEGERVLIHGASGGVGTFAVQLAKALGGKVTALCSTRNVEQSHALGADEVIDYTQGAPLAEGRYDLILATNGYRPIGEYKRALAPGGRYLSIGGTGKQLAEAIFLGGFAGLGSGKRFGSVFMRSNLEDLEFIRERLADGSVRSVIDRTYPFEELPAALAYLEEGHARGKVVIEVA